MVHEFVWLRVGPSVRGSSDLRLTVRGLGTGAYSRGGTRTRTSLRSAGHWDPRLRCRIRERSISRAESEPCVWPPPPAPWAARSVSNQKSARVARLRGWGRRSRVCPAPVWALRAVARKAVSPRPVPDGRTFDIASARVVGLASGACQRDFIRQDMNRADADTLHRRKDLLKPRRPQLAQRILGAFEASVIWCGSVSPVNATLRAPVRSSRSTMKHAGPSSSCTA
jgi:hypothetical protein